MESKLEKYQTLLSRDEVLKIVEHKIGRNSIKLINYVIKPASENPMGFLGEHILLKVCIEGKEDLLFFIKKKPSDIASHLQYAEETRAFYKEVQLYKTLFLDLQDAQNKLNPNHRWRPEFYFSRGNDMIVIEDLTPLGYIMPPERTLLDEDHIIVALNSVARMHAASIIYEEKFNKKILGTRSEKFILQKKCKPDIGDIYSHLTFETEASDIKGHIGNTFCEVGAESEVILIDLLEGYTKEEIAIIKEKLPDEMRKMMKMVKPSEKYKNLFLHGDLWSNNLLFRYDGNGHVEHAMIVDFQLARYGPPAHDIVMLLHLTQNRSFREKYEKKLIKYYYEIFSKELQEYGLTSEELYPWKEFEESYYSLHEFGVITSVYYFQLILLPPDIVGKFLSSPELFHQNMLVDRSEMIKECFLTDSIIKERVTDSLNELIQKYIL